MFLVKSSKTPTAPLISISAYTLPVMPPGLKLLPNWFTPNQHHLLTNTFSLTELNKSGITYLCIYKIDLSLPTNLIKKQLTIFLWNQFTSKFNLDLLYSYHMICSCYHRSSQPFSVNFGDLANSYWVLQLAII